jgi:hypothetical protein
MLARRIAALIVGAAMMAMTAYASAPALGLVIAGILGTWLVRRRMGLAFRRRDMLLGGAAAGLVIALLLLGPNIVTSAFESPELQKSMATPMGRAAAWIGMLIAMVMFGAMGGVGIAWGVSLAAFSVGLDRRWKDETDAGGRGGGSYRRANPAIKAQFPALAAFVAERFPPLDAAAAPPDPADDPVAAHLAASTPDAIRALVADLDRLLAMPLGDEQVEDVLLTDLGCGFDPAFAGLSARAWLTRVRGALQAALATPAAAVPPAT